MSATSWLGSGPSPPRHARWQGGGFEVFRDGLGFSQGFLKEAPHVFSPGEEAFGHSGMGGALGLADPGRNLALGYVMNRMDIRVRSPRCLALCHALYGCI